MKKHFDILDGLRGSAALMVVVFHIAESFYPDPALNPLHHAYLAVDFFFLLSGYVIGYAYDDRWQKMSIGDFFNIRLIRLHPLVILGVLTGAIGYLADPFAGDSQKVSAFHFITVTISCLFLLPSKDLPNRWGETHSVNGPAWSLLQEYLANIVYAVIGRKLGRNALIAVVVISAAVLTVTAVSNGNLGAGWGWPTFWIAPVRVAFPFFAGLLLFRTGFKIKLPAAYTLLSLVLLILFALPFFSWNGLYEAACIILVFPLIVAAGAGSEIGKRIAPLCRFFGAVSYPVYILHYPFIYIYSHWIYAEKPSMPVAIAVGAALAVFFIVYSWLALRYYDEPIRKWLTARKQKSKMKAVV